MIDTTQPLYPQEFDPSKTYGGKYTATSQQAAELGGIQLARLYLPAGLEVMIFTKKIPYDTDETYVGEWRYPVNKDIVPVGFQVRIEKT